MPRESFDPERVLGPELGVRVLYCHMLLSQLEDDHVTLTEFGERVAAAEGEEKPYSPSSVSRWESGEAQVAPKTVLAICALLNKALKRAGRKDRIDPGWLLFGDATAAKGPGSADLATIGQLGVARSAGRRGPKRR